jgi:hypothetical protein
MRREIEGSIQLKTLKSFAEAMGCELVYGFVREGVVPNRAWPKRGDLVRLYLPRQGSTVPGVDLRYGIVIDVMFLQQTGVFWIRVMPGPFLSLRSEESVLENLRQAIGRGRIDDSGFVANKTVDLTWGPRFCSPVEAPIAGALDQVEFRRLTKLISRGR